MANRSTPPTSVRDMMNAPTRRKKPKPPRKAPKPKPKARRPRAPAPKPERNRVRKVSVGDDVWVVRVVGQTRVASRADAGPHLLSVAVEDPDGKPLDSDRLHYVVGTRLSDVPECALRDAVREAIRRVKRETNGSR